MKSKILTWFEGITTPNPDKVKERLERSVEQFTGEDWNIVTGHRYKDDLTRQVRHYLKLAQRVGIPTQKYETQLNATGIWR